MKHTNFTKLKTILLALVLTVTANQLFAQTSNGIFFQAVARDNFSNPAKDRKIFVQTSIIQTTITGTKVLTEEHQATTDASGVFSISIGNGTRVSGTAANLASIDWSKGPFFLNLKVSITPVGGTNSWDYTKEWVDMGTTNFGAVPFSFYAASVAGFDTKLNVADSAKMLLPYAKTTTVNTLSTSVDNKLATKLNIADSTNGYVTPAQLAAKTFDQTPITNAIATKLNIADSTKYVTPTQLAAKTFDTTSLSSRINLKANTNDVSASLTTKLNISDSVTKYITPTQLASYNFSSGGGGTTIDTTFLSNRINLKANASDLTSGLALKANVSDVTTSLNLKANSGDVTSALNLKANVADLTAGLALKVNTSQLGIANGIATLNSSGIIPSSQLPPVTLSSTSVVTSDADMIALSSASVGSIAIRTDLNKNYVLSALPASTLGNWVELLTPAAPVQTVNGYTGSVNIAKSDIGLGNVDNTSDVTKPVSTATQAALDLKLDANKVGVASGVASLNALGKVPTDQIPAISFSSVKVLGSQADMLALTGAVVGSVVIRTDVNKNYVLAAIPATTLGNWIELLTPAPPVQSVNGMSGSVSLTKASIGLGNVDNTSDASKPISTLTQNALNLKAPLASPTFTGTVTTGVLNSANINATIINTPIYASTPQTLTDASTINWNPALGLNASVTLGGNRALSFTSTPAAGSYGTLVVTQDATGGRTITLPTTTNKVLKSSSTTSIALSSAPGAKDIINFYYDGTYCYWNIGQGYGVAAVSSALNAGNLTGTVSVANGGTGATTLTGLVKGSGTSAFTAAVAGTDYQEPLTLTTTGTGAATLSGTILNIPTVASTVNASTISGTVAIANGGTGATTATSALANLTGTQAKNKIFAGPSSSIVTLATFDGSSTSGFTIGSGVTVDNTVGNPSPSIKSVGGGSQYYYKDFGQDFKNKTIEFDIRLTQGTGGIAIGANSSGGQGVGLVINMGTSNQNGLRTADTWGYPPRGYDTYTFNANTWYSIKIITDNGALGGVSWYVNGTFVGTNSSVAIGNGTYFGFTADYSGTVVNFDNLTIKDNSGLAATPSFRALVADDIPTLNQNTTGNAATATSATSFTGNLSGDVSGTQSSTVVNKINGTSLAGLSTGILKNTTSTGVPTIAVAGTDYQAPLTLTTTGTGAATLSGTTLNIPTVASNVNASSISGTVAVVNGGTGVTTSTGSGDVVLSTSPTLVTPNLGTPSTLVGTNISGTAANLTAGNVTTNANLTGDVTSVGNAATLASSGVVAGSYGSTTAIPTFTVDSKGRLTAASTVGINAGVNSLTYTTASSFANGGTVSGTTLTLAAADANNPGLISTGTQTIAGAKTFSGGVTSPIYASAPQTLTDGSTISWNPNLGLNASVTLGGDRTLSFTNTPTAGSYGTLVITQDATGGRNITLPSTANKILGSTSTTTIALSTSGGAKDILNFYYDGTNCFWSIGQGYGLASSSGGAGTASYVTGLNNDLGGYVFYVTPDGKHGLVAETFEYQDTYYNAPSSLIDPSNHSTAGKNFLDWRLPQLYELNLMYNIKSTLNMPTNEYWSGTSHNYNYGSTAFYKQFSNGVQYDVGKDQSKYIRAVRAF